MRASTATTMIGEDSVNPFLDQSQQLFRYPLVMWELAQPAEQYVNGIDHVDSGDWRDVGLSRLS